jgi:hypothetical protein
MSHGARLGIVRRSWRATINRTRCDIRALLKDSPRLRPLVSPRDRCRGANLTDTSIMRHYCVMRRRDDS